MPSYQAEPVHRVICEELQALAYSENERLIITMPPRHGKSEILSRKFPAWYLGQFPSNEVIAASYNSDLAGRFGVEVRNLMQSDVYRQVFSETELSPSLSRQSEFMTTAGGGYRAVGVGGATTGFGANVFIVDDPIKDQEQADSDTYKAKVWDWFQSVALTRLERGGSMIVCATRWAEDDLIGRLLEEQPGTWRVIHFPAISDSGEALCPHRKPLDELLQTKSVMDRRKWEALYQGRPAPEDGVMFRRRQFQLFSELPSTVRLVGASDFATTDGGGDYSVLAIGGLDSAGNLYVVDVWRGQEASDTWLDAWVSLVEGYEPLRWGVEGGVIWNTIEPFALNKLRDRHVGLDIRVYNSTQDKVARARGMQSKMSAQRVYFKADAPWLDWLRPEMLTFPAGKHDDGVDTMSLLARVAEELGKPPKPKPPARRKRKASAWAR